MKSVKTMTLEELAAFVCSHLHQQGVRVVLSGGACVSIYTKNRYQSFDLDFIENIATSTKKLVKILDDIGFHENQRYFKHPAPLSFWNSRQVLLR